jgi:ATP-dependent helicase/nuclease subunit B
VKLVNGLDLQLLAYLGVLRDAANAPTVFQATGLRPAGAFYVSLRAAASSGKNRAEVLELISQARRAGYQHRGRFRADLLGIFDDRGLPKGDQFRYSVKKDGGFSKTGNEAIPGPDFERLVENIEQFLRQYGRDLYQGDARVAPYRHKSEIACGHCNYRAICRFDPWVDPYRVLRAS